MLDNAKLTALATSVFDFFKLIYLILRIHNNNKTKHASQPNRAPKDTASAGSNA